MTSRNRFGLFRLKIQIQIREKKALKKKTKGNDERLTDGRVNIFTDKVTRHEKVITARFGEKEFTFGDFTSTPNHFFLDLTYSVKTLTVSVIESDFDSVENSKISKILFASTSTLQPPELLLTIFYRNWLRSLVYKSFSMSKCSLRAS